VLEILTAAGSMAAVVVAIPTVGRLRLAHSSRSRRMVRKMNNDLTSYQSQTEILLDNADKVIKQLHKKSRQTLREIAIGTRLSEGDVRFVLTLLMPREKIWLSLQPTAWNQARICRLLQELEFGAHDPMRMAALWHRRDPARTHDPR
jgi:hypothetical protein